MPLFKNLVGNIIILKAASISLGLSFIMHAVLVN